MLSLGDYLGFLLAEITNARFQADLESARIAQLYASHPLLQHMPVPRFRLPNVVLNVPVAVEKTGQPSKIPLAGELPPLRRRVEGIIEQELNQRKLRLAPVVRKRLTNDLNGLFGRLKAYDTISASDVIKVSDEAVAVAVEAFKAASEDPATVDPAIESALRRQFGAEFLKLQPPPPRVDVMVVTAQLKDIAPPQTLTRIQLTISEEGVEWTQTNPSDTSSKTLLPE
jgi:hypothetical protein